MSSLTAGTCSFFSVYLWAVEEAFVRWPVWEGRGAEDQSLSWEKAGKSLSCLVRAEFKSSLKDHLSLVGHIRGKLQARG